MAAQTFANQTFDESEDEDDDFNPQPIDASDDENEGVEDANEEPQKPSRSSSAPRVRPKDESEDEGKMNRRNIPKDQSNGRRKEADKGIDEELDGENGEEDEGEGEDLNGGLDDDEEDEDEDEDEEAVSVGL